MCLYQGGGSRSAKACDDGLLSPFHHIPTNTQPSTRKVWSVWIGMKEHVTEKSNVCVMIHQTRWTRGHKLYDVPRCLPWQGAIIGWKIRAAVVSAGSPVASTWAIERSRRQDHAFPPLPACCPRPVSCNVCWRPRAFAFINHEFLAGTDGIPTQREPPVAPRKQDGENRLVD
ncbi:hypothetical protein LX32DRAFT_341505 [Colletotrichum zoysiae]|uniref:Uncharacterized protein n=1 Tax=Colletotrichum zoysiae TaxID=1216348 RepID=A0AAD9HJB9_9PEZI|nr:hypothetical protein LX32DRAFT_341505 [Colletotrichum zoysiae]